MYINFIDYEKAFYSVDRQTLWKLLRDYGVSVKIVSLIECIYQDMGCRVVHADQISEKFQVKTAVRQGCLLSPFSSFLVIHWIMRETMRGKINGIQWILFEQLDDLYFAEDLALLAHNQNQIQDKTCRLETFSAKTGLRINLRKTELIKINTTAATPIAVGGEPIKVVESFVYLGSTITKQGGTDEDVTSRIGKARGAFIMLKRCGRQKILVQRLR